MTVGLAGLLPHAPWTIGLPSVSRIVAVPPNFRIVSAASFAPSRMADFFVGSAEIVGISTKSRRRLSNGSRFFWAKERRLSFSSAVLMHRVYFYFEDGVSGSPSGPPRLSKRARRRIWRSSSCL